MGSKKRAPSIELRKKIDPLGEIESLARKLCAADGSNSIADWEDYWEDAEKQLTGGLSKGSASGRARIEDSSSGDARRGSSQLERHLYERLSGELCVPFIALLKRAEIAAPSSGDSVQVSLFLAQAFKQPLKAHESECLGYLLRHSKFTLISKLVIGPFDSVQTGMVLSELSG